MQLIWKLKSFEELTTVELYAILQLRNEVFVVEQNCAYQDADGKDQMSWHLCGWMENELVAYCRLIPPGISYAEASIGRVVTSPAHRKAGLGRELMQIGIEKTCALFSTDTIRIGAQCYLEKFYNSLDFTSCEDPYLEDRIPHVHMLLKK